MGIFGKKNPYVELSNLSNFDIMNHQVDGSTKPFLFFPRLLSSDSNSSVEVVSLEVDQLSKDFRDFSNQLLNEYNSQFEVGTESPRPGGDEIELSPWPNYTILKSNHPFRIQQDPEFQNWKTGETEPENFHRKTFSFFVLIDSASIGKLYIIKKVGVKAELKEIVDLGVKVDSPLYFVLWSLCSKNPEIKSSLLVKAKFCAGNSNLDKFLISIPRPTEAVKIALYLSKVKFDS